MRNKAFNSIIIVTISICFFITGYYIGYNKCIHNIESGQQEVIDTAIAHGWPKDQIIFLTPNIVYN
jgi:hypothetical protein